MLFMKFWRLPTSPLENVQRFFFILETIFFTLVSNENNLKLVLLFQSIFISLITMGKWHLMGVCRIARTQAITWKWLMILNLFSPFNGNFFRQFYCKQFRNGNQFEAFNWRIKKNSYSAEQVFFILLCNYIQLQTFYYRVKATWSTRNWSLKKRNSFSSVNLMVF